MALVDWDTLCSPKVSGGLGLRDPEISNEVMGARIWWRWVAYSNEPWAQLWYMKYAPGWEKQSLIRYAEETPGSHIWMAAKKNRLLVQQHSFWEIGNGQLAYFFKQ